ncbi:hypothetical protein WR25_14208 [Diploscapter pachys]|uniref:PKD domain-containing protein n=1 Tax=Diploscapter pachys TaxID=2018661 RepID=A0A2A2LZC5_9BILA|nr:hypothetical protein WR25_14208 [Diploscapter pachys]
MCSELYKSRMRYIFILVIQIITIYGQSLSDGKKSNIEYCDVITNDGCKENEYCKPPMVGDKPPLEFTIQGPSEINLPEDSATLKVVPKAPSQNLTYLWEVLEGVGSSVVKSFKTQTLELSQLKEGSLLFRVTITDGERQSSQDWKLVVNPAKSVDLPPKAVIRPESPVRGVSGSTIVLDAEGSTGDKKIVSYKWTLESGPTYTLPATNTAILRLENLDPGKYNFSVLVVDEAGQSSSASVLVEIYEERDDPPKAVATECGKSETGSITLRLPLEKIYICGNSSTDDKGIVSYNWFRIDNLADKLPIDGSGSTGQVYTLTNIQSNELLGPYEFRLEVKDAKGQSDSTTIKVFVNKALNLPPVADAGGNKTLILPESSIVLDANAKDDGMIVSYRWTQKSGPTTATLLNADKAKATASDLKEGIYEFELVVVDDGGLNATAHAFINVQRGNNEPPIAKAKNVTVHLPAGIAALNGSESTDDAGIVSYKWAADEMVPASMMILDKTNKQPVLFISGLVVGVHSYNLTVKDQQGEAGSTLVYLTVERGKEDVESVEILMNSNISVWSQRSKKKLETRIEAALQSAIVEADEVWAKFVRFESIPDNGRLRAVFYAKSKEPSMRREASTSNIWTIIEAQKIVRILRKEYSMINEFNIESIATLYCKFDCSGHGRCNDNTKQCECDAFWMTSLTSLIHNNWRNEDCGIIQAISMRI